MVKIFFSYALLSLRRERTLAGLILGSLFLAAGALFLGATLLADKALAACAFFEAINTPFVALGVTSVALITTTRQQHSGEKDFFFAKGLSPPHYTLILALTHILMLMILCAAAVCLEIFFFQIPWPRSLAYGTSLLGQGALLLWLNLTLTHKSSNLPHHLVFMFLLYLLGRLRGAFLLTLVPSWKIDLGTGTFLDLLLQGFLYIIPPFDQLSNEHLWLDLPLWTHAFALACLACLSLFHKKGIKIGLTLTACLLFSLQTKTPSKIAPDTLTPGPAPTRALQTFASLSAPSFYGYAGLFHLHHTGDLNGQRIPLKDYHYPHVVSWLTMCGDLLPKSHLPPLLGAFYYGASPVKAHRHLIAQYLDDYGKRDRINKKTWQQYAQILKHSTLN